MNWRIELSTQEEFPDTHAQALLGQIREMGITSVQALRFIRVFLIDSDAQRSDIQRAAAELLADPVTERFRIGQTKPPHGPARVNVVEVHLKPGVMDPVATSTIMALADMNIKADSVRTARKYLAVSDVAASHSVGRLAQLGKGVKSAYSGTSASRRVPICPRMIARRIGDASENISANHVPDPVAARWTAS